MPLIAHAPLNRKKNPNTNLVDVLPCLGGRFHVRHIPAGRSRLAVGQRHFALVVQIALVADEQQRYRLVALDAQYLLAATEMNRI